MDLVFLSGGSGNCHSPLGEMHKNRQIVVSKSLHSLIQVRIFIKHSHDFMSHIVFHDKNLVYKLPNDKLMAVYVKYIFQREGCFCL